MGTNPKLNAFTRGRLTAFPHDNVLRWRVQSLSRPDIEHLVDLGAWTGNGSCSCEHFEFRLAPALREGAPRGTKATRCGHIVVAREAFTNHMVQLLTSRAREAEEQGRSGTVPCPQCQGDCEDANGTICGVCDGLGHVPE